MAKRRRKKPNGSGSIIKLSGNRAKPYLARSPMTEVAPNVFKRISLGTFATVREAEQALFGWEELYNKKMEKNYSLDDVYNFWIDEVEKYDKVSPKTIENYKIAYRRYDGLKDRYIKDLNIDVLQPFFDGLVNNRNGEDLAYSSKKYILTVLSLIFEYAIKHDIIEKDYTKFVILTSKKDKRYYGTFSSSDINLMFSFVGKGIHVEEALIMIYTALRPAEFFNMSVDNVDIDKRLAYGLGVKTKKGKARITPLSLKIIDIVKSLYDEALKNDRKYLFFTEFDNKMSVSNYSKKYFPNMLKSLGIYRDNLKPYSCRHTGADLMRLKGVDAETQTEIMGHESYSTTADNYHSIQEDILLNDVDSL